MGRGPRMPTTLEQAKADLIDRAIQTLRQGSGGLAQLEAAGFECFLREYYRRTPPDDIIDRSEIDLFGMALAHWELGRHREAGTPHIRVYTPVFEQDHWQSGHTAVQIVTDDMPFLVDSTGMQLSRQGHGIHLMVHPVFQVQRDADGHIVKITSINRKFDGARAESFIHIEIDRQTEPEMLEDICADLARVLADVRAAYEDWPAMRQAALDVAGSLGEPVPTPAAERDEARALLEWMADDHFTFLGYREYNLLVETGAAARIGADGVDPETGADGADMLRSIPGTGLGILRHAGEPVSTSFAKLPAEVRTKARDASLLNLTKSNAYSTVHRPTHLDYVGVKRFDAAGNVVGERRFLGLWSAAAYNMRPEEIPVLRRKLAAVMAQADFPPDSHDGKDLLQTLETYPRDELFQISVDDLCATAVGILSLQERRRVRLFVRRDQRRVVVAAVGVDSGPAALSGLHRSGHRAGVRRGRHRVPARRGRPVLDRRPARGVVRAVRGRARPGAVQALPGRVPGGVQRGLPGPHRGHRPRAAGGADQRHRPADESLPPGRGGDRRPAVQDLPVRRPDLVVRRVAHAAAHGRAGRGRAALPRGPTRRAHGLDLRLRPAGRARPGDRPRPGARPVPGGVRPDLARRGGERRPEPAGAGRRAGLARGQRAARLQPVPAPGRHPLQPRLHGGEPVREHHGRPPGGRAVLGPV